MLEVDEKSVKAESYKIFNLILMIVTAGNNFFEEWLMRLGKILKGIFFSSKDLEFMKF